VRLGRAVVIRHAQASLLSTAGGIGKFDFPTGRVVTDDVSNNGRNDLTDVVTITPTTVLYLIRSHF
jgi:hypothetical protein